MKRNAHLSRADIRNRTQVTSSACRSPMLEHLPRKRCAAPYLPVPFRCVLSRFRPHIRRASMCFDQVKTCPTSSLPGSERSLSLQLALNMLRPSNTRSSLMLTPWLTMARLPRIRSWVRARSSGKQSIRNAGLFQLGEIHKHGRMTRVT